MTTTKCDWIHDLSVFNILKYVKIKLVGVWTHSSNKIKFWMYKINNYCWTFYVLNAHYANRDKKIDKPEKCDYRATNRKIVQISF